MKNGKKRNRSERPDDAGRDEMNLSEFPITCLSERAPRGVTTLEFAIDDWDASKSQLVKRSLTVEASPKHGLPTAKDDEVVLGLIQLTKSATEFQSAAVSFCQRELLQILSWSDEGRSYKRLSKAFHRLLGIRLYFENAWRDNENKQFISQGGFGILSSFELRDSRKRGNQNETRFASEFEWNSVFFKSFQDGYLKKLDYRLVRSFEHAATKRLYRFLDKRFFPPKKTHLAFCLHVLCFEHLGVSRRTRDVFDLKRILRPAIRELEVCRYIEAATDTERFQKTGSGVWAVTFDYCGEQPQAKSIPRGRSAKPQRNDAASAHSEFLEAEKLISGLSETELRELELAAVTFCKTDKPDLADGYFRTRQSGGSSFCDYRRLVLLAYAKRNLTDKDLRKICP